jgi:hypothetical protein
MTSVPVFPTIGFGEGPIPQKLVPAKEAAQVEVRLELVGEQVRRPGQLVEVLHAEDAHVVPNVAGQARRIGSVAHPLGKPFYLQKLFNYNFFSPFIILFLINLI